MFYQSLKPNKIAGQSFWTRTVLTGISAMAVAAVFFGLVLTAPSASAAVYVSQGVAASTNLLSASSASGITNFYYNIAALPATSSVRIQFSKDNTNWYSAAGVLNEYTAISTIGGANLSLAAFAAASSWTSGNAFYYKMELNSTTDLTGTPAIEGIRLDYAPASGYEEFVFSDSGYVGIGDTTPSYLLTVGSGDLFGVNSSGAIAAAKGITNTGVLANT